MLSSNEALKELNSHTSHLPYSYNGNINYTNSGVIMYNWENDVELLKLYKNNLVLLAKPCNEISLHRLL